jgi:hypothetical protein
MCRYAEQHLPWEPSVSIRETKLVILSDSILDLYAKRGASPPSLPPHSGLHRFCRVPSWPVWGARFDHFEQWLAQSRVQ